MGTDEKKLNDLREKLTNANPELKAKAEELIKAKEQLLKLYERESESNITIDGKPAKMIVYKRGIIEVQFRDMDECKQAIEKLTK